MLKELLKMAAIMGTGVTVVLLLSSLDEKPRPQKPFSPVDVPGFLDLTRAYFYLLDPANSEKTYAIDPGHKLHFVLEEPIVDDLFPGQIQPRFIADLPRFVCADGDDSVPAGRAFSAREAFALVAEQALQALEKKPQVMDFYARNPGAEGFISVRIIDRPPSLN